MLTLRKIVKLQEDWKAMVDAKKVTKKAICDLCIPFRDEHGLTDKVTLALARNELSLNQIADLIDGRMIDI